MRVAHQTVVVRFGNGGMLNSLIERIRSTDTSRCSYHLLRYPFTTFAPGCIVQLLRAYLCTHPRSRRLAIVDHWASTGSSLNSLARETDADRKLQGAGCI